MPHFAVTASYSTCQTKPIFNVFFFLIIVPLYLKFCIFCCILLFYLYCCICISFKPCPNSPSGSLIQAVKTKPILIAFQTQNKCNLFGTNWAKLWPNLDPWIVVFFSSHLFLLYLSDSDRQSLVGLNMILKSSNFF